MKELTLTQKVYDDGRKYEHSEVGADNTFRQEMENLEIIEKNLHKDRSRLKLHFKVAVGAIIQQARNIANGELENYDLPQLMEKKDKLIKHLNQIDIDSEYYKELTFESSSPDYEQFYIISGKIFNLLHYKIKQKKKAS